MQNNNRDIESIHFRVSQQEDQDFLWKALYHTVSVPPGSPLPNREVVKLPMLAQYVDSWMKRPGDLGIVAIEDKTQIGAAWIRKWIGSDQGYGFVDTATNYSFWNQGWSQIWIALIHLKGRYYTKVNT